MPSRGERRELEERASPGSSSARDALARQQLAALGVLGARLFAAAFGDARRRRRVHRPARGARRRCRWNSCERGSRLRDGVQACADRPWPEAQGYPQSDGITGRGQAGRSAPKKETRRSGSPLASDAESNELLLRFFLASPVRQRRRPCRRRPWRRRRCLAAVGVRVGGGRGGSFAAAAVAQRLRVRGLRQRLRRWRRQRRRRPLRRRAGGVRRHRQPRRQPRRRRRRLGRPAAGLSRVSFLQADRARTPAARRINELGVHGESLAGGLSEGCRR